MNIPTISFPARLWLALTCWIRLLSDAGFAARVKVLHEGLPLPDSSAPEALTAPKAPTPRPLEAQPSSSRSEAMKCQPDPETLALQLLGALQREGRFIDFVEQDVQAFGDAEVGAAARVVHEGCRKALRRHVELEALRLETEGDNVEIAAGFDAATVKLTGNVTGSPPYRGKLRHKGWRAKRVTLPEPTRGHDARIIFPAEIEL